MLEKSASVGDQGKRRTGGFVNEKGGFQVLPIRNECVGEPAKQSVVSDASNVNSSDGRLQSRRKAKHVAAQYKQTPEALHSLNSRVRTVIITSELLIRLIQLRLQSLPG